MTCSLERFGHIREKLQIRHHEIGQKHGADFSILPVYAQKLKRRVKIELKNGAQISKITLYAQKLNEEIKIERKMLADLQLHPHLCKYTREKCRFARALPIGRYDEPTDAVQRKCDDCRVAHSKPFLL